MPHPFARPLLALALARPLHPRALARSPLARPLLALALLFPAAAPILHAQGCTQCRDNAAATPPATQRAYRRAITLLAFTAGGIFLGTVALLRRPH